jgi:hypothetical protein
MGALHDRAFMKSNFVIAILPQMHAHVKNEIQPKKVLGQEMDLQRGNQQTRMEGL